MDELKQVFAKYQLVVVEGRPAPVQPPKPTASTSPQVSSAAASLLDLGTPGGDDSTSAVMNELADLGMYDEAC